jgi:hypothetical protein
MISAASRAFSPVAHCHWFIGASLLDEEFDEFDGNPADLIEGAGTLADCLASPVHHPDYIPAKGRGWLKTGAGWKPRVLRSEKAAFARQMAPKDVPLPPKTKPAPVKYFDGQIVGNCKAFEMADGTFQLVPMRRP